tara:strand:- start:91040 stop:92350 length:1311 start_codon:yes stop_codon:yes gene_type:complete
MKIKLLPLVLILLSLQQLPVNAAVAKVSQESNYLEGNYTLIIEGYDWGPAVKKVVIPLADVVTEVNASDYSVAVKRSKEGVEMQPAEAQGNREILFAYVSDQAGNRIAEGNHISLVLLVHPNNPLDSPIKYIFKDSRGRNQWIDYHMSITHTPTSKIWDTEGDRIYLDLDRFDLKGTYTNDGTTLSYASFVPEGMSSKIPLIIWLHGGGEGGTDPSIALIANKATNYATEELQSYFGGAFVLVPQTPTFWMESVSGDYTRGDTEDIYNKALFNLIESYVAKHPNIDADRIYVGGCSNGGYMSLKLILNHPKYFAAGYISALAYQNKYITDDEINRIKNVPMWFVHSKDDTTTVPDETVVPLYNRLIAAGASNVHFSFYDHVIDLSGFYGGKDYYFPGHWSWVYSHSNDANFDYNQKPVQINGSRVTIMEWLATQKR